MQNAPRDELIEMYFNFGFSYDTILSFLQRYHNCSIGLRQLHRILKARCIYRRNVPIDAVLLHDILTEELDEPGQTLGYRMMYRRLMLKYGLVTNREVVRLMLRAMDPSGVDDRRCTRLRRRQYYAKRPDFLWHIDGWDKLKRYGLTVHGAIDGFSRKILWLKTSRSNNDPFQVCVYFAEYIKEIRGLPYIIRADRGTENINVETMQRLLRSLNVDDRSNMQTTFLYGRSTSNQRIEAWWSILPGLGMLVWKEHFRMMELQGIIDTTNPIDIECIRFVYMELLKAELHMIKEEWNMHHIRNSRTSLAPCGKPDVMYNLCEEYGGQSFRCDLDMAVCNILSTVACEQLPTCESQFIQIFESIMVEKALSRPSTLIEAATLLTTLLDTIDEEMEEL